MKKLLFLLSALAVFGTACSSNDGSLDSGGDTGGTGSGNDTPQTPATVELTTFAVKTGSQSYYASIDQSAGTAKIGTIQNTNRIDAVTWTLSDPDASVTPDPQSFIGNWKAEQSIKVSLGSQSKTYRIIFTEYQEFEPEPDEEGMDYPYNPDFAPKDDERQVYEHPGVTFTAETIAEGDPHPNAALAAAGWRFFTANEFSDGVTASNDKGETIKLPYGLYPHDTATMNESAEVRNDECSRVEDGHLIMEAFRLPSTVKTGFTNANNPTGEVDYKHAAYRTYPTTNANYGDWFTFMPNMRIEVRFRRTNTIGFNNAIWFQGNVKGVPWPAYGEIDLLENPKPTINHTMHSTLHSQHFNSGGPKEEHVGPSITATVNLDDMTRWNIYWIELYPDRVVCGVNGAETFSYTKGTKVLDDNGNMVDNPDWPWDQSEGFYMIFSTGMNDKRPKGWQGLVRPSDFSEANPPAMEVDWVRVYVNGNYNRGAAKNIFY